MDLSRAKLICGNGKSTVDEINVNFVQIPIQTKTFLKDIFNASLFITIFIDISKDPKL